jgi:hypothetical protein
LTIPGLTGGCEIFEITTKRIQIRPSAAIFRRSRRMPPSSGPIQMPSQDEGVAGPGSAQLDRASPNSFESLSKQ